MSTDVTERVNDHGVFVRWKTNFVSVGVKDLYKVLRGKMWF